MLALPFPRAAAQRGLAVAMAVSLSLAPCAHAQAPTAAAAPLTLELNKTEPTEKGCRIYVVVGNGGEATFQTFKLDLVLFRPDGVIGRRLSLDLAPIKPAKKTVKLFDLDGQPCEGIASVLLNDVLECKVDGAAATDCLSRLTLSSLTKIQFSK